MSGACDPAAIIRQSPRTEIVRHRNGDTPDIIETIMWMDAHSAQWINTAAVECLRGDTDRQTLHNVWSLVRNNLRYQADRPGHERVQSPGALFTGGTGDCKSFSIATGALLRALGYRYRYRFTAYEPGDYTHVYVVATTPDGEDVPMDAVPRTTFGREFPYRRKKDVRPPGNAIAALPPAPGYNPPPRTAAPQYGVWAVAVIILALSIWKQ